MEYPFKDLQPLDEVLEREGYYKDWTHLDPEVFYSLTQISEYIKTKGYGVDVRLLIAQLAEHFSLKTSQINQIELFFKDIMQELAEDKEFHSLPEIAGARGGFNTLGERLNETTAQLAQKATKGEIGLSDLDKNKTQFDETWMTDEFKSQMAGNTPIHVTPADGSLTPEKFAFPVLVGEQGKNLFNKDVAIQNQYISWTDGTQRTPADAGIYYASDWIPIRPNTTYTLKYGNQTAFYDVNGIYISGFSSRENSYTFKTPSNAAMMRMTISGTEIFTQQLELGELSTPYVEYENVLGGSKLSDSSVPENKMAFPVLSGKKSRNLFNKETVIPEMYIRSATGEMLEPSVQGSYNASGWIRVEPETNITIRFIDQCAFYDKDRVFIEGHSGLRNTRTLSVPSNAYWFRTTVRDNQLEVQQIVEGNTLVSYESHGHVPKAKTIQHQALNLNITETPEEIFVRFLLTNVNKKIKLIGDSITHGMGGTGFDSTSSNGSLIPTTTIYTSPNSHSWANSFRNLMRTIDGEIEVINWGISGKTTQYILEHVEQLVEDDDDLIILQIGTNDRRVEESWQETYSKLVQIIDYVRYTRGKDIILMSANPTPPTNPTPSTDTNFNMFHVNLAIKKAVNERNMAHISNYDAFLKYMEYTGRSISELLADGLHPNDLGYDIMFQNIVRSLGVSYILTS